MSGGYGKYEEDGLTPFTRLVQNIRDAQRGHRSGDEPKPPGHHAKLGGHHWLEKMNEDQQSLGLVVLQWNPGAKRWSHSGNVGTNIYVDTAGWLYVELCLMPGETK